MKPNSRKAILVEDNDAEAMLMKLVFNEQNKSTELIHCTGGEELFVLLKQLPASEISYIILDLNMPKLDGIDILRSISKNAYWRHIPTIILTSSINQKDIASCYKLGANAYVNKPVVLEDFDKVVKAIENFWGEVNIRPVAS